MRRLLQILTVLTISATSAFAQLGVSIERTITLPNTHGLVRNIVFQDYDFDGTSEVAFWDDSSIAVYSITGDSILWSITVPTRDDVSEALNWRGVTRQLLFDDCNRDSIPDLVAFTWGYFIRINGDIGNTAFFDGASGFTVDTLIALPNQIEYPVIYMLCDPTNGSAVIADFDGDGYKELLRSYANIGAYPGPPFHVYVYGASRHYYSFPDSTQRLSGRFLPDKIETFQWPNGSASAYALARYSEYNEFFPYPDCCIRSDSYGFLNDSGAVIDAPVDIPEASCITQDTCLPLTDVTVLATGNVDAATLDYEFVVQSRYQMPDPNRDTFAPTIYITANVLSCYRAIGGQAVQEVWSHQSKKYYHDGIYLSQYPGFFFAFDSAGALVMFRGDLGNEFHRTSILPNGKLSWANIYPDSSARLIASHDSTIEVYTIDASTGADTRDNQPLPAKFTLGTPYPNPFNPTVTIPVETPRKMNLTITAYNILGEKVEILFSGKKTAGQHRFTWNAGAYPSGVYFISVTADGEKQTKKISLVK